jgi:hypothetical protein
MSDVIRMKRYGAPRPEMLYSYVKDVRCKDGLYLFIPFLLINK